ncbi:MAG: bifunctional UDP-N-acetylmuramoyl-tripeptide:D-alanyl-D-alanine ligase/alanine racemase [Bacteroidota bacterium]
MPGIPYTIQEIAQAGGARDLFQGEFSPDPIKYIAYDTRRISHGAETLFVALRTDNRDGHAFIPEALKLGVKNFLTEQAIEASGINYALCDDCLDSLQLWARHHRSRFDYPVIAITGSNGKTTVKEWLASLLDLQFQIAKSPMSYNSQLGVALSLLQLHPAADLAIIEAGISLPGEMAILQEMIHPTLGVFTHFGPAHREGFESESDKLQEKLQLFQEVETLLLGSWQQEVMAYAQQSGVSIRSVGKQKTDALKVLGESATDDGWEITLQAGKEKALCLIPLGGEAAKENALLAILVATQLGISLSEILSRLPLLQPVEMRSEMVTDNPDITIINDSYNSDPDSVRNAFGLLMQTRSQEKHQIILSDIPHLGEQQESIQQALLNEAMELVGESHVRTVGEVFASMDHAYRYRNTEELLAALQYEDFVDSTVLLKGARKYAFEQIIPRLTHKANATYLKINLNALARNFRFLKSQLPEGTMSMCMVKAFSYGSGSWEIAQALEREGASYLVVAYASEAITLRQNHIRLPIMVMNPDLSSIEDLIQFGIEPEVSNFLFLERYVRAARLAGLKSYPLHLKLETGMGRLGFVETDLDQLGEFLTQHPDIQVVSVMSHLAAADEASEDLFSHHQVQRFEQMYAYLRDTIGLFALRHILNTAGILRFPQYAMEMVRMGIGLYGINPAGEEDKLEEIGSLYSLISQIQTYPRGSSIGYGRSQYAERETRIATIPIGYADGIPRAVSNGKMYFLVRGKKAPIFGRVCMDMLMLDVTEIPSAQAGDEVVIFGHQGEQYLSVNDLAIAAETIAYEILVRISPRVRRVYVRE